jgi:hypothetical protein
MGRRELRTSGVGVEAASEQTPHSGCPDASRPALVSVKFKTILLPNSCSNSAAAPLRSLLAICVNFIFIDPW